MAVEHTDSTIGLLKKVSGALDKTLGMFSISDIQWATQMIVDELGDMVKDIEQSMAEQTQEQLAHELDTIGNDITPDMHDDVDIPLMPDQTDKDIHDGMQEYRDIMGEDMDVSPTSEDTMPIEGDEHINDELGLDDPGQNPMDTPPEENTQPEIPQESPQQEDYKPFSEDMPQRRGGGVSVGRSKGGSLGEQAAKTIYGTDPNKKGGLSPSQKQQKMRQLQQLKQSKLKKFKDTTDKKIKPFEKEKKRIKDKINEINDDLKSNRNKMIKETLIMVMWVAISIIALVLGLIFTLTIILAIPIGIPILQWAITELVQTLAKYAAQMAQLVAKRVQLIKNKAKEEKNLQKEQKKRQKMQARDNKRIRPFTRALDKQIQQLQQS